MPLGKLLKGMKRYLSNLIRITMIGPLNLYVRTRISSRWLKMLPLTLPPNRGKVVERLVVLKILTFTLIVLRVIAALIIRRVVIGIARLVPYRHNRRLVLTSWLWWMRWPILNRRIVCRLMSRNSLLNVVVLLLSRLRRMVRVIERLLWYLILF